MNEEENQAFKILHFYNLEDYGTEELKKYIKIIVNLVEKQQEEIKARLEEIDSLYKMMSAKDDKIEQMKEDYQILKDDIEGHNVVYVDTPEFEEKYISKDKLKEIIEEQKKFLFKESSKYDEDDIEHRKAIQYASARLSFLLADIYKLGE